MLSFKRRSEAAGQIACAAAVLAVETASYGMDSRRMPTREMVINADGQPVWRVCGGGVCIETGSGIRAQAEFEAMCISAGLEPPQRGPSEVDEPGV